ncbi:hypothetical protein AA16373_0045 [Komagataeibacter swingsii DSM 16373]|nr:hypothetical protein AA16373_0045 [Komagataeibacter swingsii DSM 16373]
MPEPGVMTAGPILCERLRIPPFDPAVLKPTQWATAQQKAKLGNAILRFIALGMPAEKFTPTLYSRLSNMFGFIAHYNRTGFAQTWFDNAATRRDFLDQVAREKAELARLQAKHGGTATASNSSVPTVQLGLL